MRADTVEAVAAPEGGIEESMEAELHADEAKPEVTPADEDLMLAWSRGSAEALAALFSRHKGPIYGFFRRRTREAAQAEELTQETFLVLVRKAVGYEPRAMFRTYLYAIAFKILRSHRRKAMFRAAFFGETGTKREAGRNDATEAGLWVRRAVEKLDRKDREILMLREYEQLNYDEIGTLLGLPLNTVRSRLFRAREALRQLLEPSVESQTTATPGIREANAGERV
jgi:RNA polymerase sigma-70 factor, ECF subfamily